MPFEHLALLTAPESSEAFAEAMSAVAQGAGADHFLAVRLRGGRLDEVVQVIHDAPRPDLVQGMKHWSLMRLLDGLRASPLPVLFGAGAAPAPEVPGFASGAAAIAHEARGAVVIVLGRSSADVPADAAALLVQVALMAAHHALDGLKQLHTSACPLSERELQCLQLTFAGEKSSKAIGLELGISARTVEHYLEQARTKLGVDSTMAAGVRAVDQGWMDLPRGGPIQFTG